MLKLKIKVGQFMAIDQSVRVFLRKKKDKLYFEAVPVRGAAPRVVQLEHCTIVGECKFAVLETIGQYYLIGIAHPPRVFIVPEDKHLASREAKGMCYAY